MNIATAKNPKNISTQQTAYATWNKRACKAWNDTNLEGRFTKKIINGAIHQATTCKACESTAKVRSS